MTYDLQGHDSRAVSNDRVAAVINQATASKNRMELLATDVSWVQTQLSVAKQQLDCYQVGVDNEQRSRKALEGKWQHLERQLASLRSEKSLMEDQLKALQQKRTWPRRTSRGRSPYRGV